jgi:hypothetical protein
MDAEGERYREGESIKKDSVKGRACRGRAGRED